VAAEFPLDLDVLQRVLDYLNDAVYITDKDRKILLWNRRAEEITGHRREDVVGRACHESVLNHLDKDGDRLCHSGRCPLFRAMTRDTSTVVPQVIYALTAQGGRIPVSVSVAALHDEDGNVIGGIEIFRDESEPLRDLEFARRIQQSIMTESMPACETLELAVEQHMRDLVGGDFYAVLQPAAETVALLIADVRGHGISAALYTTALKSIWEGLRDVAGEPGRFMTAVNRALVKVAMEEVFATAFYMVVDGVSGSVRFANAGHPYPLRISAEGEVSEMIAGDMPLGFLEDEEYEEFDAVIAPGEMILLYTDGAAEITGRDGRLLGAEGLAGKAAAVDWTSGGRPLDDLYEALLDHCAGVHFEDDVLLLSCRRR